MNKKKINTIFGILLLGFCIAGAIWELIRKDSLEKKHEIGIGTTTDFIAGGRGNAGGIWIDYVMDLNGKKYEGSSRYLTSDITSDNLRAFNFTKLSPWFILH